MFFTKSEAIKLAVTELETQKLDFTKQFLQIHQILYKDNQPVIARVDTNREKGAFLIYFALQKKPYFFVVIIRIRKHKFIVDASYVEAKVRVYLSINSRVLNEQQINALIGLKSTRANNLPKAKKFYNWQFEPQKEMPDELEKKLDYLLNYLEPYKDNIALLPSRTYIAIQIAYKGYKSCMWGWHLTRKQIKRIAALRCEIDFDLYAYGDDLPE